MKTKRKKKNQSNTLIFHSKKGFCRTRLSVPSVDPHGFESDENLELTDSSCKGVHSSFLQTTTTTTPGISCRQAPATPSPMCTMCATFLLKTTGSRFAPPETGSEDTTSSMQCNQGAWPVTATTGCYNNANRSDTLLRPRETVQRGLGSSSCQWGQSGIHQ